MTTDDVGRDGPRVLDGLDAVRAAVGTDLGPTGWVTLDAERVARFAAAAPGAPADSASPWLLLALTNLFMPEMVEVRGVSAGLNVGTGEVRFGDPVPVGARVRGRGVVAAADDARGGVQTTIRITVEVEDREAHAVVVDALSRWLA